MPTKMKRQDEIALIQAKLKAMDQQQDKAKDASDKIVPKKMKQKIAAQLAEAGAMRPTKIAKKSALEDDPSYLMVTQGSHLKLHEVQAAKMRGRIAESFNSLGSQASEGDTAEMPHKAHQTSQPTAALTDSACAAARSADANEQVYGGPSCVASPPLPRPGAPRPVAAGGAWPMAYPQYPMPAFQGMPTMQPMWRPPLGGAFPALMRPPHQVQYPQQYPYHQPQHQAVAYSGDWNRPQAPVMQQQSLHHGYPQHQHAAVPGAAEPMHQPACSNDHPQQQQACDEGLPAGWHAQETTHPDREGTVVYYYHEVTKETTWEKPTSGKQSPSGT